MRYKKITTSILILAGMAAIANASSKKIMDVKNAVVRIDVVSQNPDYREPWKMESETYVNGSGCIIDGRRILTNAHIVANHRHIQVKKAGHVEKYTAEVEFIAHDCDLALLKVKNQEFFKGVTPIKLGDIPTEGDSVTVYGFPIGGNKISITQGVVSRIEMKNYYYSGYTHIAVQIDAAINPGNSGGPVMKNERLVGVAFQGLGNSTQIGYIIPEPVIMRFFKDIHDGKYDGFPSVECRFQKTENQAMRSMLKMNNKSNGVYITGIEYGNTLWNVLKEGDVLLSIDGVSIASDGTIEFADNDRIDFRYIMTKHQVGDEVELIVLRRGEMLKRRARLQPEKNLVPYTQDDVRPSYFIFAGLLFIPLTLDYISYWDEPPTNLLYNYIYGKLEEGRSQVVLLSKVMAHEANNGYHGFTDSIISRVNGKKIGNMADLPSAFAKPEGEFHIVELEDGYKIILAASEAEKAHEEILKKYNITKDRSDDLK